MKCQSNSCCQNVSRETQLVSFRSPSKYIWQAINDIHIEMSQKASEKYFEGILEFMHKGSVNASANRGTAGVQFQTPVRTDLDTIYMTRNGTPIQSGRDLRGSESLKNQDSNLVTGGSSGGSTRMGDKIKVLRKLLYELQDKVYRSGGSGYTFQGRPVQSQLYVEALLEKANTFLLVVLFPVTFSWTLFTDISSTNLPCL